MGDSALRTFGPDIWVGEGPVVSFYGFLYPTRMAVVRLHDGSLWVWSPISLSSRLRRDVESLGTLRYLVSPNRLHHLFDRRAAKAALARILAWPIERVVLAHGELASTDGAAFVRRAFAWLLG